MPSTSEKGSDNESTVVVSTRLLGLLATGLPTITIFLCVVSAFFTHEDKVRQYVLGQCFGVKIIIAPVSYSIATWRPQRQLWMLALIVHLPARTLLMLTLVLIGAEHTYVASSSTRTLLMLMYPQSWRERGWRYGFHAASSLEILALVLLSLFHMASSGDFYIHFVSFGLWWMATIIVMIIIVHMQRATMRVLEEPGIYRWWLFKVALMTLFIIGSCSTSISYLLSQAFCSVFAFTLFCIGEYTLITLNATFWTLVLVEFSREFEGFQATFNNCFSVVSIRRPSKIEIPALKAGDIGIKQEISESKAPEIKETLCDVDK